MVVDVVYVVFQFIVCVVGCCIFMYDQKICVVGWDVGQVCVGGQGFVFGYVCIVLGEVG